MAVLLVSTAIMACKSKSPTAVSEVSVTEQTEVIPETAPAQIGPDSVFAIYERTLCFGMCPYFNLKIYKNGEAIYEGKNFVDMIGFYHTTFDIASLQKLKDTADHIQYFSLQDTYDNPRVTDLPTVITGVWDGNKLKTVSDRYKGPDELEEIYQLLEEMIQGAKWTPLGK